MRLSGSMTGSTDESTLILYSSGKQPMSPNVSANSSNKLASTSSQAFHKFLTL